MADSEKEQQLPSPPFHAIAGLPNFRDIGGYPVSSNSPSAGEGVDDGKKAKKAVRRGIVYRSSEPSQTTDGGVSQLQALGITYVFDLRSAVEIEKGLGAGYGWKVKEWEGARRVFVPVFLDQDYSPEQLAVRYRNYSSESAQVRFCCVHASVHLRYITLYAHRRTQGRRVRNDARGCNRLPFE